MVPCGAWQELRAAACDGREHDCDGCEPLTHGQFPVPPTIATLRSSLWIACADPSLDKPDMPCTPPSVFATQSYVLEAKLCAKVVNLLSTLLTKGILGAVVLA